MSSLEERIAAELREVLAHQVRGGFGVPPGTEEGMAVGGPDSPEIVLTVEDVARLAARVVELTELAQKQRKSTKEWHDMAAERGFVSTPEGRAWAKRVLAEGAERRERSDYVKAQRDFADWVRNPIGPPPWGGRPAEPEAGDR